MKKTPLDAEEPKVIKYTEEELLKKISTAKPGSEAPCSQSTAEEKTVTTKGGD